MGTNETTSCVISVILCIREFHVRILGFRDIDPYFQIAQWSKLGTKLDGSHFTHLRHIHFLRIARTTHRLGGLKPEGTKLPSDPFQICT